MAETVRQQLARQLSELRTRQSTFRVQWKEICDNVLPYRARWNLSDSNKGEALSSTIINSTPSRSLRILAAGLMAGITSPSRNWFKLTTSDPSLKEVHAVSVWLAECERIIRKVLLRSRWYQTLADGGYRDLGLIASAAMTIEEDDELFVRFAPLPIGEWYFDTNHKGIVDTCFREVPYTVKQLVDDFGYENVSKQAKIAFNTNRLGHRIDVVHAVYPNQSWQSSRADVAGMGWLSKWWETKSLSTDQFLRESGFSEFPILAPRWNARGTEAYGRGCPGWESVGDAKALQHLEKELSRLVEKTARPPMAATADLRQRRASLLPGDITFVDKQGGKFEPAITIPPAAIVAMEKHIARHENRVERAYYVDLWMAILNDPRKQRPTATEVEATRDEVMLQIGPLLENLNNDLLDPAIERTFRILERRGQIPEPPVELQGTDLEIQYISILHQAQKLTSITGIRELVTSAAGLAQAGKEEALDKIDADAVMDELTEILGVRPELVLSADQVAEVRAARAARQQAQEQGEAMLAATEGAKNLSAADPAKLSELATLVTPAAAAQGGL